MNPLNQLATEVLLGTERRAPALPALPEALDSLLAGACPADTPVEIRVLRLAGILASCASSASLPPPTAEATPSLSPPEERQPVSESALIETLRHVLANGPDALRIEAMRLLVAAGFSLPPRLIPRALELGQKSAGLRGSLLPALGQRGDWLARQNPAWSWAVGAQQPALDPAQWEHGTLDQRRLYLRRLRSQDPGAARDLLREGFAQLDARERGALLEQLQAGLTSEDEAFLESLLADRSKEVRQLAGRLLSSLPSSRFSARMATRVAACLSTERKLFRQVLILEAPQQFGAGWKDDALEEARAKTEPLGERAWWLYQLARSVPLAWWLKHTGMTPAQLIKWLPDTDWSEAMLRAWGEALQRERDAEWAEAFLAAAPMKGFPLDAFALIDCLPLPQREPHWAKLLESGDQHLPAGDVLLRLVQGLAHDDVLSPGFASRVLHQVRKVLPSTRSRYDYNLRKALPEFLCFVPAECLHEATEGWPMDRADAEYFTETVAAITAIAGQRKILHSNFLQRKPR